jgi:hypothetical protein
MSELGSGSGSSYPGALDTDNDNEVNSPNVTRTKARAEVINDLNDAVVKIQTELGTDPAGTLTDVKTYLQTEHNANGTHKTALTLKNLTIDDGLTLTGDSWPSFRVTKNANQTAFVSGPTKVTWPVEDFDTNSDFATNRFTPSVAGKYLLHCQITSINVPGTAVKWSLSVYENNTALFTRSFDDGATKSNPSFGITTIVDANGTTDYYEIFATADGAAGDDIEGDVTLTFFTGSRIA